MYLFQSAFVLLLVKALVTVFYIHMLSLEQWTGA